MKIKIAKILSKIDNVSIMNKFLKDITTPQELDSLQERLDILLLLQNNISYSEIAKQIGCSTTTVTRVSRFLNKENNGGYKHVLKNLDKFKK